MKHTLIKLSRTNNLSHNFLDIQGKTIASFQDCSVYFFNIMYDIVPSQENETFILTPQHENITKLTSTWEVKQNQKSKVKLTFEACRA